MQKPPNKKNVFIIILIKNFGSLLLVHVLLLSVSMHYVLFWQFVPCLLRFLFNYHSFILLCMLDQLYIFEQSIGDCFYLMRINSSVFGGIKKLKRSPSATLLTGRVIVNCPHLIISHLLKIMLNCI